MNRFNCLDSVLDLGFFIEFQKNLSFLILSCVVILGEESPVLAKREICSVPVLCSRPNGRVQHATIHLTRIQSDRCQGKSHVLAYIYLTGFQSCITSFQLRDWLVRSFCDVCLIVLRGILWKMSFASRNVARWHSG